jgi:FKBP-type peptidyl-prolyl cis-trans isomerase
MSLTMGVERVVVKPGNGTDFPKKNDEVSVEYTGTTTLLPRYN